MGSVGGGRTSERERQKGSINTEKAVVPTSVILVHSIVLPVKDQSKEEEKRARKYKKISRSKMQLESKQKLFKKSLETGKFVLGNFSIQPQKDAKYLQNIFEKEVQ